MNVNTQSLNHTRDGEQADDKNNAYYQPNLSKSDHATILKTKR